jgi:hypothetical protein
MGAYGVILDTSMLRNLLHTDFAEARELIGRDIVGRGAGVRGRANRTGVGGCG